MSTVKSGHVHKGHPGDLKNGPLNTRSVKLLTGRDLMPILMAHHT